MKSGITDVTRSYPAQKSTPVLYQSNGNRQSSYYGHKPSHENRGTAKGNAPPKDWYPNVVFNREISHQRHPWYEVKQLRKHNSKSVMTGCLNNNSLQYKYVSMCDVFKDDLIDVFSICEIKLDDTFPMGNFKPEGYSVYRRDSTGTSGGILSWVCKYIPYRRTDEIEEQNECIQSLCLEIYIKKQKWMLVSLYHLPEQHKADLDMFSFSVSKMVDNISAETDMIIMIGDFNIDPLKCEAKSRMLCDLMSVNNMKNINKGPTCFKGDPPSIFLYFVFCIKVLCFNIICNENGGLRGNFRY